MRMRHGGLKFSSSKHRPKNPFRKPDWPLILACGLLGLTVAYFVVFPLFIRWSMRD